MSWFTDYLRNRRNQGKPMVEGVPPITGQPVVAAQPQQTEQPQVVTTPQPVNTTNAIGSLAEILGPTPAERELAEARRQRNKSQMTAWTSFFDGLRHLGNLYYTSRGASPQKYNNPYEQIEKDYAASRQRANDLENNQRQYNLQLYNLQRQADQDAMSKQLHEQQLKNYQANNELTQARVESVRSSAEEKAAYEKARRAKIELQTEQMRELQPLQKQKLEATIRKIMHDAGRPYAGGRGGSGGASDPFVELAEMLNDNPDVIGPVLEQEGYGFYDVNTGSFQFTKNPTKGMATTAVQRAKRTGGGGRTRIEGFGGSPSGGGRQQIAGFGGH